MDFLEEIAYCILYQTFYKKEKKTTNLDFLSVY